MDSNDDLEKALGALNLKDDFTHLLNQLKRELLINETCHRWVKELNSPVTDEELKLALAVYTTQFEDFSQRDFECESDLQFSAVETVSKRCLQAQIHITLKNFEEASSVIAETYHLINDCLQKKYIGEVYRDGLLYLVKTLEITNAVESFISQGESDSKNSIPLEEYLVEMKKYTNFNAKNTAVVLAMKHYFLGNIRRDMHAPQIEIIKKVIQMDRENPEWHCCLYAVLKFKKDFDDYFAPPSDTMMQALINGLESVPGPISMKDPRLRMGLISVLAELLKHNIRNFSTLKCGRYSFNDPQEVVDFIRDEADDILGVDPMSVRSNINIAKIFSSTLPLDYQDRNFARACIKRALLFHPNSSKALHRMGIFYLATSMEQALKYFEKAFECDERNYLSFHDLIKTYLSNIPGNRKKIDVAFDKVLNSKYYKSTSTVGKVGEFIFYKAIYKFLDGKKNESMDLFVDAFTTSPSVKSKFKEIGRGISRYKWNTDKETLLGEIRVELEKSFMTCTNPTKKQIFKTLLDAIFEAERPRFTGNRGRGRGFHSDFNSNRGRGSWRGENPGSSHSQNRGFHSNRGGFPSGPNFGSQSRGFNSNRGGFRGEEESWRGRGYKNQSNENTRQNWRGGAGDDNNRDQKKNQNNEKDDLNNFLKSRDHWSILGVAKTASRAEIKKAFFKLAQENHPDKNMDIPEEERLKKQEKMKLINKAYEALYQ